MITLTEEKYQLEDLPTAYAWFNKTIGKPVSSKCVDGEENYLWSTEEDAYQFMKNYMMAHGITDLNQYRLYELKVSGAKDGEAVMGYSEAANLLDGEELEAPAEKLEQGDNQ